MKKIYVQIKNEWRSNLFLFMELFLVFIVLWYIVDWVVVTTRVYTAPMGFDVEHCYDISIGKLTPKAAAYNPALTSEDDMQDLLEVADRLRHRPGVEAVALSQNCYPYNEGSNGVDVGIDTLMVHTHMLLIQPDFFRVFKYSAADGSGPDRLVEALRKNEIVVTSNLTEDYPQLGLNHADSLLGRQVPFWNLDSDVRYRIGAVGKPVRWSHFYTSSQYGGSYVARNLTMEQMKNYGDPRYLNMSLRVSPEEDRDFINRLMEDADRLYQVGNLYLLNITSFKDLREINELEEMTELKTQFSVLGFLLLNIFLGVVGTFWFRTQQRRQEVALRMAMGSSRRHVFLRLMAEGILLLTLAALPAAVVAFNIGLAELVDVDKLPFDSLRLLSGLAFTWLLMSLMIVAGIWYPARGAMKVRPAEALHDE